MPTKPDDDKGLWDLLEALRRSTELKALQDRVGDVFEAKQESSAYEAATLLNFFERQDPVVFRNLALNGQPLKDLLWQSLELIVIRTTERLVFEPDLDRSDMTEAERLLAKLGGS